MKPIGSEFYLPVQIFFHRRNNFKDFLPNKFNYFFKSGRDAIKISIKTLGLKAGDRVLLPSYLCYSILQPFVEEKIEPLFYKIKHPFVLDESDLLSKLDDAKVVFIIHYFGFPQNIDFLKDEKVKIIEDCTHNFLSQSDENLGEISIASLRKLFPISGGGLLSSKIPLNFKPRNDAKKYAVSVFKTSSLVSKSLHYYFPYIFNTEFFEWSFWFDKKVEEIFDGYIEPSSMSEISEMVLLRLNFEEIIKKRRSNFLYLLNNIKETAKIEFIFRRLPSGVVPLGFPVWAKDRLALKYKLLKNRIYPPIHWELPATIPKTAFVESYKLSNHVLTLPVDQRYTERDMERIVKVIDEPHTKSWCGVNTRNKRKVGVVTGSRAEYGLLFPLLSALKRDRELKLSLLVTGMHLFSEFGLTVEEIRKDGFKISATVNLHSTGCCALGGDSGADISKSVGIGVVKFTDIFNTLKLDFVLIPCDRWEMLSAAIAASFMQIPIGHIHGGDATTGGCIDEPIRHSISKFAHLHFPATKRSAERLARMGEERWRIHIVGPLGIYDMGCVIDRKKSLFRKYGLNTEEPLILFIQHPVSVQQDKAGIQMEQSLKAIKRLKIQTLLIYPNCDPGGKEMIEVIKKYQHLPFLHICKSLPFRDYLSALKYADVIAGNSSSGIVEAPFFGTPVVNIGIRQRGRERGEGIMDVPHKYLSISKAIREILSNPKLKKGMSTPFKPYGGAKTIIEVIKKTKITPRLLMKRLTY